MSTTDTVQCPICKEQIPTDYVVCPYDGYSLIKQLREKIKAKIKFTEGIGRAIRLLRSPIQNTSVVMEEVTTNSDRKGPLFILFILSWVFGFQVAPYFNAYYLHSLPLDIGWVLIFGILGGFMLGIATFIFFLLFWYIVTIMIHFSSKMFASSLTGSAAFKETQSIVGYALAPYIVGMFILDILLFFIVPSNVSSANFFTYTTYPTLKKTIVSGFGSQVSNSVGIFYLVFFVGFSIWSVFICATGIEKLHRLPKNQSYIIPGAVIVLIIVITYF